jgi:hypothetical protein
VVVAVVTVVVEAEVVDQGVAVAAVVLGMDQQELVPEAKEAMEVVHQQI